MQRLACGLCLLLSVAPEVHAIPIHYGIQLTMTGGWVETVYYVDDTTINTQQDAAGNIYYGAFTVDSGVLSSDGYAQIGDLQRFFIKMEDNIWAYNYPFNNSLSGFLGPGCCDFSSTLGFDVFNGEITGIVGGAFNESYNPYIAFFEPGSPEFLVSAGPTSIVFPSTWSFVVGEGFMEVFRIPEPSTLALILPVFVFLSVNALIDG